MLNKLNKLSQRKYDCYIKSISQIQQNLIHFQPKIINTSLLIRLETTKVPKRERKLWVKDELELLENAFSEHGNNWSLISKEYFKGSRTPIAISSKWRRKILKDAVSKHGNDLKVKSKENFKGNRTPEALSIKKSLSEESPLRTEDWTEDEIKMLNDAICKNRKEIRIPKELRHKWESLASEPWSEEEDELLFDSIKQHGTNWKEISKCMNRAQHSVIYRYYFVKKNNIKITEKPQVHDVILPKSRRRWTKEDDDTLLKLIDEHGNDWIKIAKIMKRSKSSVYKHYILITDDKRDKEDDDQRNLTKPDILDENHVRRWTNVVRYKINSRVLQQCQNNWQSFIES